MDEFRALQVVAALRSRGVNADLYQENGLFGVRVSLAGEHEAEFGSDEAGLDAEATVMPRWDQVRSLAGALG